MVERKDVGEEKIKIVEDEIYLMELVEEVIKFRGDVFIFFIVVCVIYVEMI